MPSRTCWCLNRSRYLAKRLISPQHTMIERRLVELHHMNNRIYSKSCFTESMNCIIQSTWHYCNKLHGETQMQCLLGTIIQSRRGLRHRAKKKGTNRRTWYCKNRHKMKASKSMQNHSYTHKTLNEQGWNKQLQEGAVLGCVWRLMITLLSILIVLCQYVPVCYTL